MPADVTFSDVSTGSFALSEPDHVLVARRQAVTGTATAWLTQIHSNRVVVVDDPNQQMGEQADALVTALPNLALSVITADCAPVLLAGTGVVGAVHAGWRGLVSGVLENAVGAMRDLGASEIKAWLGPCIRSRCYEFGADDLAHAADVLGERVRATTAWGTPALDVVAGVHAVLRSQDVVIVQDCGVCTACSPVHFSHRARRDVGRIGAFIKWQDQAG